MPKLPWTVSCQDFYLSGPSISLRWKTPPPLENCSCLRSQGEVCWESAWRFFGETPSRNRSNTWISTLSPKGISGKKGPKVFPLKQRTPSERIPLPSRISCFLLEGHSARPRWWNLGHGFYLRPFPNFAFNKNNQTATFGRLRWSWWLWQRLKSFSIYPTGMSTVCGKWIINYNPYISRL